MDDTSQAPSPEAFAAIVNSAIAKALEPVNDRLAKLEADKSANLETLSRVGTTLANHDDTIRQMAAEHAQASDPAPDAANVKIGLWIGRVMGKYFAHEEPSVSDVAEAMGD